MSEAFDYGAKMESAKASLYVRVRSLACLDDAEMARAVDMVVHGCCFSRQVCCRGRSRKACTAGLQLDFELAAAVDEDIVLGMELATVPVPDWRPGLRLFDTLAAAGPVNVAHIAEAELAVHPRVSAWAVGRSSTALAIASSFLRPVLRSTSQTNPYCPGVTNSCRGLSAPFCYYVHLLLTSEPPGPTFVLYGQLVCEPYSSLQHLLTCR